MLLLGALCLIVLTSWSVAFVPYGYLDYLDNCEWRHRCKNGGTVQNIDEVCSCNCLFNTSGLNCEYVFEESEFPDGSYALPMSTDGCPEGASRGWGQGYINFTTTMPLDDHGSFPVHCRLPDVDRLNIENNFDQFTNITGSFGRYSLRMNFCLKSNKHPINNSKSWPTGAYGLFRTKDKCPDDFSEQEIKLCIPPVLHYNVSGELPYYEMQDLVHYTELTFRLCRRLLVEISLNANHSMRSLNPFLVVKDFGKSSLECPSWDGYIVKDESFPFALPTRILNHTTNDTNEIFPLRYCHYNTPNYACIGLECKNGGTVQIVDQMCSCNCPYKTSGFYCEYDCFGLECKNGGTVQIVDQLCLCKCPIRTSGLYCEYVLQESVFPDGSYALPMSIDGCPEGASRGWGQGYINITTTMPFDDPRSFPVHCRQTVDDHQSEFDNDFIPNTNIIGPFGHYSLQMNFCLKSNNHPFNNSKSWPTGTYGLFGTMHHCPYGFSEHEIKLCLPPLLHYNADGELPYYEMKDLDNYTELTFRFCRRLLVEDAENANFSLLSFNPFLVIKDHDKTSLECPSWDGYIVSNESFPFYIPTTILNHSTRNVSAVYPLRYCHFNPAHYGLPNENDLRDFIYETGFPGIGHTVTGISAVFNLCWNQNTGCEELSDWLIIDARQTAIVSAVMLLTPIQSDILNIYISDMKWSFLNGGALLCRYRRVLSVLYKVSGFYGVSDLYRCYRSQLGRYITLSSSRRLFGGTTIYKSFDVGLFTYIPSDDLSSERCNEELGMIDHGIADSQITTSSWQIDHPPTSARPQHQGWCAAENDTEPYIQIDLRCITSVDGVRLYNWFHFVESLDTHGRTNILRFDRTAAFQIKYGIDENHLTSGNLQIFKYERSLSLEDPQTFVLVNSILARFIRFLPKPFAGNSHTCIKFELLGCKTSDLLAKECPDIRPRMTSETSSADLPSELSLQLLKITTNLSCRAYHSNSSDCVDDLQFDAYESCTVFTATDNQSFLEYVQLSDSLSVLCISERQNSGSGMFERQWIASAFKTNFNITKIGYFTSPGFPFTYPFNVVYKWTLNLEFPVGTHVGIQFTNISLKASKEDDKCRDKVIVLVKGSKITYDIFGKRIIEDEYSWTNKDNDQTPSIDFTMSDSLSVYIAFDVCSSRDLISDGKGFRALIYSTERKPCIHTPSERNTDEAITMCNRPQGELIEDSVWGKTKRKSLDWKIYTGSHTIMTLEFIEMEVICSLGSRLILFNGQVVCNQNRPYADQTNVVYPAGWTRIWTSTDEDYFFNYVTIQYLYSATPLTGINQGFRISYQMKNTESNLEDGAVYEVCSTHIGKCFTIRDAVESSWKDAAEDCRRNGELLASLKTEKELRFVKSLIMKHFESNRGLIEDLKIYIGLFSFIDTSGKLHESWFDGTSPTYTAWDTDQPLRRNILRCTQINIQNPNVINSWKSCPCDEKTAYFVKSLSVCERPKKEYTDLQKVPQSIYHGYLPLGRDPTTLFHCSSGEWMSRLVMCNGVAECFDASDEIDCIFNDVCDNDDFVCADGTCLRVSKVCDYKLNCLGRSDAFCVYSDCNEQFKCDNGQCISTDERCDSVRHCKDGSDEINCDFCNGNSFHCTLSRTCISKRFVCDKFEDCSGGTDEQQCNTIHFETCKDLWLNGRFVSGYFKVKSGEEGKDMYVFCDFESVEDSGNLKMTIFNSDTIPINEYRYEFRSPVDFNEVSRRGFRCTQRITILPHRNRLRPTTAETDETYVDADLSEWPMNIGRYFFESTNPFERVYPVEWNKNTIGVYLKEPLKPGYIIGRGDIICNTTVTLEEITITNTKLFCRQGISAASRDHRCLYKKDTNGYVTGCRTLEHLNNCDNFVCPEHYFKCPRSYCISLMYVCDGNNDCAYGEDELVCACPNKPPADIVVVAAVNLHEQALQLAGMLYSQNHTVRILNIKAPDFTLIGTEILTNTKYSSKVTISYFDKNVENVINQLFLESERIRTLIVISKDKGMDEEKLLLTNLISAKTKLTYKLYNVTIAKASKLLISQRQREFSNATEIILNDEKIIGTIGPVLFPELCNGTLRCPGFYRCRLSKVCIPQNQVCDHTTHCPYGDDEDHCDFVCPSYCSCDVLIVNCSNVQMNGDFNLSVSTRVLDISHSQSIANELLKKLERNISFPVLVRLNASWCGLKIINTESLKFIPRLISLDLSYNNFSRFEQNMFVNLKSLEDLFLTGNQFLTSIEQGAFNGLKLKSLIISGAKLSILKSNTFSDSSLTSLYIVGNDLMEIDDYAFNGSTIEVLNIDENSIKTFGKNIFSGVIGLKHLTTPAYKFCCLRPMNLAEENCLPLKDEFSSCTDLMRNTALQALLWIIGLLALFGNMFSLFYRLKYDRQKMKLGYGIFVTNLAVSDLMMGIYMLIIAVADTFYRDRYIENDDYWRNSGWCKFAGILSTLSSEGSVLFLFLITIDRLFVVKFPYGQIRFRTKSAMVAATSVWIVVLVIAILPVVYVDYFQERFYSKTGVCLALPLTRDKPPGWLYSILIFIVFNMIAFILIAVGQCLIFLEIKKNSMTKGDMNVSRRENDLKVARNLLLVVTTDFACWFPVCTMGLMALSGHVIPGEVYAWTSVLILPVNSALNPFLYTISAIYGAKKFTPSEDEQSYTRVNTEVGKEILNVLRDVLTNKATPRRRRRQLDDLLKYRSLTAYEATLIIYQVARLLNNLHENGLVFKDIVKEDIWLDTSKNGRIKRIRVDATRGLVLSPKKADFRENVLNLGHLADFLLERIDSTCL